MKKLYVITALYAFFMLSAQFKVTVEAPVSYLPQEAYLYTLNGSKDILSSREIKKNGVWNFTVQKPYSGMLKVYFPDTNDSFNLISENKDASIKFEVSNTGKISDIYYLDEANKLMDNLQDVERKKEYILPALYQIKEYYKASSEFYKALNSEIDRLSTNSSQDLSSYPYISFYTTNYKKFLTNSADKKKPSQDEIIDFLNKSVSLLESSSLLRPILVSYINVPSGMNSEDSIEKLIKAVNIETPRGQTILSELIDIFDTYGMDSMKEKYISQAQNLKCTINDRLATTLKVNKNVGIGAKFADYTFKSPMNTTSKSIYGVAADKKIIVFWSSTCSHCEQELPALVEKYNILKSKNIQIIGLSLDTEKKDFTNKAQNLPWINDSELKGWNSTFVEKYNVHATPTFFILDRDNKIISKPNHVNDVLNFFNLK